MRVVRSAILIALLGAILFPASVFGADKLSPSASKKLWATVNVCNSAAHPNVIGIRGSMPGLVETTSLYMRFRVQYLSRTDGEWHYVTQKAANSGWKSLGKSNQSTHTSRESGWNFVFQTPAVGTVLTLRGEVRYHWRRGAKVVFSATRVTRSKHPSTVGADPPMFSSAICEISKKTAP